MKIWGFEKEISQNLGHFFMKNPLCICQILAKFQQKISHSEWIQLNIKNSWHDQVLQFGRLHLLLSVPLSWVCEHKCKVHFLALSTHKMYYFREQILSLCFGLQAYISAKFLIHILSLKCQHSKTWIWHPETDHEVREHKIGQIIPWCTQQGRWNIGQGVHITTSIECRMSVVINNNLWSSRYACTWPERRVQQTEKITHSKHHAWW
jgi:hypothetical protein